MQNDELGRIVIDPEVMGGKACVKGTRVTVATIVGLFAAGHGEGRVLALYPCLSRDDVRQALTYAAERSSR